MRHFVLEGFWLLAGFAVVYLVGVFTSQWAKDKLNGVPSTLRAALKVTEAAAVKELTVARDKIVADTASLIAKGRAAATAEVKSFSTDPAPAQVATPVAPSTPSTPSV